MLPVCCLRCPVRVIQILDTPAVNPQLNLPLDHVFVKSQVGLRREEPALDVDALDFSVAAVSPDIDPRARLEKTIGLLRSRRCHHVILMHLMQIDAISFCSEQLLSYG